METQYYKVFTGQAIDVKLVKNHLAKNGIKSFAENRTEQTIAVEWNKREFDPFMELKVQSTDIEKAVKLVNEFLNTKAD